MPSTLPQEQYKGYRVIIQMAMLLEGGESVIAYRYKLYKPWPHYTDLPSDDLYDSPDEALAAAKEHADQLIGRKQ